MSKNYRVCDADTGKALEGGATHEVIELSEESEAGVVYAYCDVDTWCAVAEERVRDYRDVYGVDVRRVYIEAV